MANRFDIAVLGGGPAGAVTALCLARRGWRTAIFESTSFHQDRFGETLPPEINPRLRRLGLWEAFLRQEPLESPGTVSTWGSPGPVEVDFTRNAFGCGWHVDRNRFDRMLCQEAVADGASLFLNCRRNWVADGSGWQAEDFRAAFLVNATGRHGLLLDPSCVRHREDALLSIAIRTNGRNGESQDQRTWIETSPAGWWYSTLLPDGTSLAMFFTGAEIYREQGISLEEQLETAPRARRRVSGADVLPVRIVYSPTGWTKPIFGENWTACGDSASSYDPLSGRGIFKALSQGEAAAAAIDGLLNGDREAIEGYASRVLEEFEAYSRQRREFYAAELRWMDHPFWHLRRNVPGF